MLIFSIMRNYKFFFEIYGYTPIPVSNLARGDIHQEPELSREKAPTLGI